MRKPDKTLIFGSNAPPPLSQRAPVSLHAPVSRPFEKQWFNKPVDAPPPSLSTPLTYPDRRSFSPRQPERGLAFAAIALTLVGIAGAGTYFFFGLRETAHQDETSTTTVTNADIPTTPAATAMPAPAPAPAESPLDLPWTPPVVDAVKAPDLPKRLEAPQLVPTERPTAEAPKPNFNTVKTVPTARQVPASEQQADDEARAAAGFYPSYTPNPGDNSVTPPPIQQMPPSAADPEVTTHMAPDDGDNTLHNPNGEPATNP